jgi:hypothetical protein
VWPGFPCSPCSSVVSWPQQVVPHSFSFRLVRPGTEARPRAGALPLHGRRAGHLAAVAVAEFMAEGRLVRPACPHRAAVLAGCSARACSGACNCPWRVVMSLAWLCAVRCFARQSCECLHTYDCTTLESNVRMQIAHGHANVQTAACTRTRACVRTHAHACTDTHMCSWTAAYQRPGKQRAVCQGGCMPGYTALHNSAMQHMQPRHKLPIAALEVLRTILRMQRRAPTVELQPHQERGANDHGSQALLLTHGRLWFAPAVGQV